MQIDCFKKGDKQHVSCGDWAQLPLLTVPFSFMNTDSSCEVRLWILHRLPPRFGFRLAASSELSCMEGQCEAWDREGKLSRNTGVQGRGFTCPRPGPQKSTWGHSWSQICYQVQKCLTEVEQVEQLALVCLLHWERKAVSITTYFLTTSSENLCSYCLQGEKWTVSRRCCVPSCYTSVVGCVDGWLLGASKWPANLCELSR